MSTAAVHLRRSDPTVNAILLAAFPGNKGQKITARISETVRFHGTNWDEGSRRVYRLVRLADLRAEPVETAPYFAEGDFYQAQHAIPAGFAVVVHNESGRQDYLEIISPAANISRLLPAPVALTDDERTVLKATGYKSSYAGVKNNRYHEARRATGITLARYDAAKQALIQNRLLTKSGAITPEGHNALGSLRSF